MEEREQNKPRLLGEATPAKASGVAFSVATILPVLFALVFLIVLAASGLTQKAGYEQSDWYLYANYLLPQLAFACTAIWYLRYTSTPVKKAIESQKCQPKYLWIGFLMQLGLFCFSELNSLFLEFLSRFGYAGGGVSVPSMDGFGFVGTLFVVAVLPAVLEEVVFRGILLRGLRSAFSETASVLLCGALFSLYHQNPAQTLYQFGCGAAYAFVAIRAGSILPTVLAHFFNNALILTLTKFGVSEFPTPVFVVYTVFSALCLIGVFAWLLFKDGKREAETDKTQRKYFLLCAAAGIVVCAATWISVLVTGF